MNEKPLKSFRDLKIWQKAVDLATLIYAVTENFPKSEIYSITSQMRRSAVSISSNIAEGFKRFHKKEKAQFYNIAYGSVAELESQLEIVRQLKFLSNEDYNKISNLTTEISKMIESLIKSLNSKSYILYSRKDAFTTIELLVAMAIFVTIVSLSSGCFVIAMRSHRAMVNLMAANDNASLAIEQIAREIRTGREFCIGANANCAEQQLVFTNYLGEQATYRLNSNRLERNSQPLTATNVSIEALKFIVSGNQLNDNQATRVTIVLKVAVPQTGPIGVRGVFTNLQTTISARNLD